MLRPRLAVRHDLGAFHRVRTDAVDARVGHPLDVAVAHHRFEQALGVADAAQPEMADIGLRRDEGHRHAIADLATTQVSARHQRELVGRPEAGRALHGADDDGAGILAEALPPLRRARPHGRRGRSRWLLASGPSPGISSNASAGPVAITR